MQQQEFDALIESLRINAPAERLDLTQEDLTLSQITILAEALADNQTLKVLNIDGNNSGIKGIRALSAALEKNKTLQTLILRSCVDDEGAKVLAAMLEKNHTLQDLVLRFNAIGNTGAKALAVALENNTTLLELDLHGNDIKDAGATTLAAMLEKNRALLRFYLDYNLITEASTDSFVRVMDSNPTLEILSLNNANLGHLGRYPLFNAMNRNLTLKTAIFTYGLAEYEEIRELRGKILRKWALFCLSDLKRTQYDNEETYKADIRKRLMPSPEEREKLKKDGTPWQAPQVTFYFNNATAAGKTAISLPGGVMDLIADLLGVRKVRRCRRIKSPFPD